MKTLLALLIAMSLASSAVQAQELKVMTFNLRYAHTTPPNLWPDRRPLVKAVVERWAPDILGTQEGLYPQLLDMQQDLPAYHWIGLGREGGSRGEFMAIFYRKDRFQPVAYDHFWLSDTPAVIGSTSWGNRIPRMVSWVRFRDLSTGREFYHVNTHLDHQSQPSRERSVGLILERVAALQPELPVVLTGDFNVDAVTDPVYQAFTAPGAFVDTWRALGLPEPGIGTFHGFNGTRAAEGHSRIDWILTRGPLTPLATEIITWEQGGQYPSDHFPVFARIRM